MQKISVNAFRGYNCYIGSGLLTQLDLLLRDQLLGFSKCVIVSDENVAPFYGGRVRTVLSRICPACEQFVFPAGEKSKNLSTVGKLIDYFCEIGLSRNDLVVALGGGVVGDTAGFAASVYLRGVRCIYIPTTLLSAVDLSVGGKTGINLENGKNLIGSMYSPSLVVCDTDTLCTLPPHYMSDGMAEVIKCAVVCSEELFKMLSVNGFEGNEEKIISECVNIKRTLIEKDGLNDGLSVLLNFGHTIGHAIEELSDYTASHGNAVSIGMAMMSRASEKAGLSTEAVFDKLTGLLRKYSLPTETDIPIDEICKSALSDKMLRTDEISVVIPVQIGNCFVQSMGIDEFKIFLKAAEEGEFEWMLK